MAGKIIAPVVNIPPLMEQGDTVSWLDQPFTDEEGTLYDSSGYALSFTIAGATAPLTVAAGAQGTGWKAALTAAQTGALSAGKYWWQAQLIGTGANTGTVITVARGELTVIASLANAAAGFSGLSAAEQSLASWQAALAALAGTTGPAVESYKINDREMRYRNIPEILAAIAYWQTKVTDERTASSISQNQGNPRKRYARFPARFGTFS